VNFADVDVAGHTGIWSSYINSIMIVDSLIYELWNHIQIDPFYQNFTTLFVTNDHGRHDEINGGFQNHGDACDGCQHIMLLAIGFGVGQNQIINEVRNQRDLAPTVGDIIGFSTPLANGTSLYDGDISLPVTLTSFTANPGSEYIKLKWVTESEIDNYRYYLYSRIEENEFIKLAEIDGHGTSNIQREYSFIDYDIKSQTRYEYRLSSSDYSGNITIYKTISVTTPSELKGSDYFSLSQNYPNPFNAITHINFSIHKESMVRLSVFDMHGREIRILTHSKMIPGNYSVEIDAARLSSGLYFYKLESKDKYLTKKFILLK
jgi:hypothetical protein